MQVMTEILKKIGFALSTIAIGFLYMWLVVAIEANYASESVRFLIFFFLSLGFIIFCARTWQVGAKDHVQTSSLVHSFLLHYPIVLIIGFEIMSVLPFSIVFKCVGAFLYGFSINQIWVKNRGLKGFLQRLHIIH